MFHKYFDFAFGYFGYLQVFNQLFVNNPSNANCDSDEGVDLPSCCLSVWMSGLYFAVFLLCAYLGICRGNM